MYLKKNNNIFTYQIYYNNTKKKFKDIKVLGPTGN